MLFRSPTIILALGRPVFDDPTDAAIATEKGAAAAWSRALSKGDASAALRRVAGDFALAWRDAQGRTLLAIDRFAVRTLCWRIDGGQLRFAERADDLAGTSAALDLQAIFDYLYFHAIPSPRTAFEGVFRLPPGSCLVFDAGRATVTPYWVPAFSPPTGNVSFDALADEFRALVRSAVARQLDSSVPACFLSGGTDSSTITGMIREVTGKPAQSWSIGFQADGYDEMA